MEKVFVSPRGCWWWTGAVDPNGYPAFFAEGKKQGAHRVAFRLWNGDIPKGLCVDHACHNRRCVRPDHLQLATPGQNSARHLPRRRPKHCKRGHRLTGANVRVDGRGRRRCVTCARAYNAAWMRRFRRRDLASDIVEKIAERHIQCRGEALEVDERDVALAALDTSDVGAIQTSRDGERLLRVPARGPQRAQARAETDANVGHCDKVPFRRL